MSDLFTADAPGRVYRIPLKDGSQATIIKFMDTKSAFPEHDTVLVTAIGFSQAVNVQFTPALNKLVYLYSFGDRMGDAVISGFLFDKECPGVNGESSSNRLVGLKKISEFYAANRAINNTKISVNIGSVTIRGFLIDFRADTSEPQLNSMRFTMTLAILPGLS
jgi:hypothetical protein